MKLLGVQHAEGSVGVLDVVHVLHSFLQTFNHSDAMLGHFGIRHDGLVPLGPWVHNEINKTHLSLINLPCQSEGPNHIRLDLPPDPSDGLSLSICPLNHGANRL
uniref:Uncharacterized protein n=1 Tax=Myripristis murdjan TaxID=586833 RepID=A0A668ACU5_9TELE